MLRQPRTLEGFFSFSPGSEPRMRVLSIGTEVFVFSKDFGREIHTVSTILRSNDLRFGENMRVTLVISSLGGVAPNGLDHAGELLGRRGLVGDDRHHRRPGVRRSVSHRPASTDRQTLHALNLGFNQRRDRQQSQSTCALRNAIRRSNPDGVISRS